MRKYKDVQNTRFGKLVALERETTDISKRPKWFCQCDCGKTTRVGLSQLLSGRTKSCGCARIDAGAKRVIDISGKKFGRLIAIKRSEIQRYKRISWECLCDCGNFCVATQNSLAQHQTISCGCYNKEKISKLGKSHTHSKSGVGRLYDHYKRSSVTRSLSFSLSQENFEILTLSNCHYCGSAPFKLVRSVKAKVPYTYNGIDRKDNNIGYELANCVPCCSICNRAKHTMSYSDFTTWLKRISIFQSNQVVDFKELT